jgi:hypothetical protein
MITDARKSGWVSSTPGTSERLWRVIRRFENLNSTRCRYPSKARPKFAIIITNQVRAVLAHTAWLLEAVHPTQGSVGDRVTHAWITRLDLRSMMTNAKSGRKKRSVTCKRVAGPDLCCVIARDRSSTFVPLAVVREPVLYTCCLVRFHT